MGDKTAYFWHMPEQHTDSGRIDIGACKGAPDAGRAEFKTSRTEQSIEVAIFSVKRIGVSARIVILQQQLRMPRKIEYIADRDMAKISEMLQVGGIGRCSAGMRATGLQGKLQLEIEHVDFGYSIPAKTRRR